jgi:hypothetical protein
MRKPKGGVLLKKRPMHKYAPFWGEVYPILWDALSLSKWTFGFTQNRKS